jgi:hypothetical protein
MKEKKTMRRLAVLLAVLAIACGLAYAEPTYTAVSATQAVTNTTLPEGTKTVLIVNDGANEIYYRLFTSGETSANATTASAQLKSGESISFTFTPGSTKEVSQAYYKTLSIICAAGETATVRIVSK